MIDEHCLADSGLKHYLSGTAGSLVLIKVFHCNPLALRIQQHKALHHWHRGVYLQWVHACKGMGC